MFDFNIKPNFKHLRDTIFRKTKNCRVPIVEWGFDVPIMEEIIEEKFIRKDSGPWLYFPKARNNDELNYTKHNLDLLIKFHFNMGYDYVGLFIDSGLQIEGSGIIRAKDDKSDRNWAPETAGKIKNWKDLEKFPWPKIEGINYFPLEYLSENIPEGMKIIVELSGPMEALRWLMDFETFAVSFIDNPELLSEIISRICILASSIVKNVISIEEVGAIFLADDLGYNTSTIVSPGDLRKLFLPCYKEIVNITHKNNLPFLLHSCGNIEPIMDDLIYNAKIDARHSFQDIIIPVEEAYRLYKNKITLIGGIDVDILARGSDEEIRSRVREVLDKCGHEGSYCFGSGNSITSYIPVKNYLIMVEEWIRWNKENFDT